MRDASERHTKHFSMRGREKEPTHYQPTLMLRGKYGMIYAGMPMLSLIDKIKYVIKSMHDFTRKCVTLAMETLRAGDNNVLYTNLEVGVRLVPGAINNTRARVLRRNVTLWISFCLLR